MRLNERLIFLLLSAFILVIVFVRIFDWIDKTRTPIPQKVGQKPYIARYLVHPLDGGKAVDNDYFVTIYCDGISRIVYKSNAGLNLSDYLHKATYHVDAKRGIFTHAEMITPKNPVPFSSKGIVDEQSIQDIAYYQKSEKVGPYLCHKYGPAWFSGKKEDDYGTYDMKPICNIF